MIARLIFILHSDSQSIRTYKKASLIEPTTWVHFDRRQPPPACAAGGYPIVRQGDKGVYVLIVQDELNTLGYGTGGLDGVFGPATRNAVMNFQRNNGISPDGVVGCGTWTALQDSAIGIGRSATTVD